jgi:hypothetical protein
MTSPRVARLLCLSLATLLLGAALSLTPDCLRVGAFSSGDPSSTIPSGWERLAFGKIDTETRYNLTRLDSSVVVRATSNGGASGLVKRSRIDPEAYPVLAWRWRADSVVAGANGRVKDGDDCAARVYVTFDHDLGLGGRLKRTALRALGYEDIPSRALNYTWSTRTDTGAVFPSPYTDWVKVLPLQSGCDRCGTWVSEQRNVAEDYRRAFGEDPPAITGIAIMTDTDNTGSRVTAYYGDIVFHRADAAHASAAPDG